MTTTYPLIRGTQYTTISESYGNDATAASFGYKYRVGEVVGGEINVVYFKTAEFAFDSADNKKHYIKNLEC